MRQQDSSVIHPIRRERHRAGLTIREVASALGVSDRTVLRWELGQASPGAASLIRLAGVLRKGRRALRVEDLVQVPA